MIAKIAHGQAELDLPNHECHFSLVAPPDASADQTQPVCELPLTVSRLISRYPARIA
jgi:hypothetical protein